MVKDRTEVDSIAHFVAPSVTAGADKIYYFAPPARVWIHMLCVEIVAINQGTWLPYADVAHRLWPGCATKLFQSLLIHCSYECTQSQIKCTKKVKLRCSVCGSLGSDIPTLATDIVKNTGLYHYAARTVHMRFQANFRPDKFNPNCSNILW